MLTKGDKLRSREDLANVADATLKAISKRPAAFPRVVVTSAATGGGLEDLRAEVLRAVEA